MNKKVGLNSPLTQVRDLESGLRRCGLAIRLSRASQSAAFRRTILGPFWFTLEQLLFILAFGFIAAAIFGDNFRDRIFHVGIGLWVFGLVSDLCVGPARIVEKYSGFRNADLPHSFGAVRHVVEVVHSALYKLMGLLPIVMLGNHEIYRWESLVVISHVFVGLVTLGYGMSLAVSTLCIRFRDLKPMLDLAGRLAFFVTPVFWKIEDLGNTSSGHTLQQIQPYNTFNVFLDPITAVFSGDSVSASEIERVWFHSSLALVAGLTVFSALGSRFRAWL